MSTFDVRHWGGLDRLSNVEQELAQVANGGSITAIGDVNIGSDTDASGAGDIIGSTGGVERLRVSSTGIPTGILAPQYPSPPNPLAIRDAVVETIFAAGHAFAKTGTSDSVGSTVADDAATYIYGTSSSKITSGGDGPAKFVASRATGLTALNATGKYLCVTLMVDHPERLKVLRVDVSSDAFINWSQSDHIEPTTNTVSPFFVANQWINLLIPWSAFAVGGGAGATRGALTGFQIRLQDNGTGPVNVWVNKISTVSEAANGVVVFTCDDGYIGQYTQLRPLLDAFGYKASFGPIVNLVGGGGGGYMTLAQLQSLVASGWEPVVHAYDAAIHNAYDTALTDAQVEADIVAAKTWMRANGLGPADNFLIPKGQFGSTTSRTDIWRRHFGLARCSYSRVRETYPPARKLGLRCIEFATPISGATVNAQIDAAITNKEVAIIKLHNVVAAAPAGTDTLTSDVSTVVSHINSIGATVKTLAELAATGVA